jgi:hypothetical protein
VQDGPFSVASILVIYPLIKQQVWNRPAITTDPDIFEDCREETSFSGERRGTHRLSTQKHPAEKLEDHVASIHPARAQYIAVSSIDLIRPSGFRRKSP